MRKTNYGYPHKLLVELMNIRQYEDRDEVKQLIRRAIKSVEPEYYSNRQQQHLEGVIPGMNLDFAEKDRYAYIVAVEDGEVIGLAGFQKETGTLAGIFVAPRYMGERIGSQLLKEIENKARKEGIDEMESLASLESVEFYRKNGYDVVGEKNQNIEGMDVGVKLMSKKL